MCCNLVGAWHPTAHDCHYFPFLVSLAWAACLCDEETILAWSLLSVALWSLAYVSSSQAALVSRLTKAAAVALLFIGMFVMFWTILVNVWEAQKANV